MELQRVKYFLALCEVNSFCQAAKQCGVAQPSLTVAIQRLEQSIGGHLFERRPTTRPTALALAIKPHFEEMIRAADAAQEEAADSSITAR
jgi:LysR family transcriptional regulator, hydrogen peroxide-inducible genes activator